MTGAPMQAPQLYRLLTQAAEALSLERGPQLFLQHSPQASMHYLELPVISRLPGLAGFPTESKPGGNIDITASAVHGVAAAASAAVPQSAIVVTSRMVELLDPMELQAMFVGTLSIGLLGGTSWYMREYIQAATCSVTTCKKDILGCLCVSDASAFVHSTDTARNLFS